MHSIERDQCYTPVIDVIHAEFGTLSQTERARVRICVPGAGLARLAWTLAAAGFSAEANEHSVFMLIISHFVLNQCSHINEHTVTACASNTSLLSTVS
jgi:carnosine N-methyltransferase